MVIMMGNNCLEYRAHNLEIRHTTSEDCTRFAQRKSLHFWLLGFTFFIDSLPYTIYITFSYIRTWDKEKKHQFLSSFKPSNNSQHEGKFNHANSACSLQLNSVFLEYLF